jgi:hypothetical protein
MAEVVGGHNEVLNNEALTAHATAITAIITIKLSGRARALLLLCVYVQRMQNGKRRWVGTYINIIHSLPLFFSWHAARLIFSLSGSYGLCVVLWPGLATQQRSCPPDLTDNTDTLCALQPLT